jgi:SAM-dependent methyltransferase
MPVDFGRTAEDYGRYRAGFPDTLFDRLAAMGIGLSGQRVLDLGTGTGAMARGFARRGCTVTGLDPAQALMEEAERLDAEAGVNVEYVVGRAEDTGLPTGTFDIVSAGQCWHWFERGKAAREALRLLRPAGRLVIAHYDWIPLPGNVVEATEALIRHYNPDWRLHGGTGIYPAWPTDVAIAGFQDIETFSFDEPALYSHEAWRGRIRASAGVAASLPPDRVEAFDRDLRSCLAARFPDDPLVAPHRAFALVCTAPPAVG